MLIAATWRVIRLPPASLSANNCKNATEMDLGTHGTRGSRGVDAADPEGQHGGHGSEKTGAPAVSKEEEVLLSN